MKIKTIEEAIDWIWGGNASKIIARQGEVAVIARLKSKAKDAKLPDNHYIKDDHIMTKDGSHAPIEYDKDKHRIIVGKEIIADQKRIDKEKRWQNRQD